MCDLVSSLFKLLTPVPGLNPKQAKVCELALQDILLAMRHHPDEVEVVGKAMVALGVLGQVRGGEGGRAGCVQVCACL